jgi:hypothetical protein
VYGPSTQFLYQPVVEPDDVKRRFAGQRAATVPSCAAQADIVCASACAELRGEETRGIDQETVLATNCQFFVSEKSSPVPFTNAPRA